MAQPVAQHRPAAKIGQPTILKLQFLYFIGMETIYIQQAEPPGSDIFNPGLALAPDQFLMSLCNVYLSTGTYPCCRLQQGLPEQC